MKTAVALWRHVRENDLCPGAESLEQWQGVRWIKARIGTRAVPILPVIGYRQALQLHDVHHMLTGYSTRFRGELELAAWELASGGCGLHLPFWVDRILAFALGLVLCPRRVLRAWRHGWRCHNLYGSRAREVLESDFESLRRRVGS